MFPQERGPESVQESTEEYGGYIKAVAEMMRAMDPETQKDIFLSVQKEKLLRELLTERGEKRKVINESK